MADRQINILLIEDNPGDARLLQEILKEENGASFRFTCVDRLSAGLAWLTENEVDAILLDLGLPDSQGLDTFLRLQGECEMIPVIVLTGIQDRELAIHAVQRGAQDYLNKNLVSGLGLLLDRSIRYAIERKRTEIALKEGQARLERTLKGTIDVISETIERKGPYPPGHHRQVSALASAIAREMELTPFQVQGIELAASVYDIGLISVPIEFLQNADQLEGGKLSMYQEYPKTGYDILSRIEFPWPIAKIALQHREHIDGSGFPQRIEGSAILIEAKILAVADIIEDLTRHRSFRNSLPLSAALEEVSSSSGSRYDPEVVAACLRVFNEKGYKMEG